MDGPTLSLLAAAIAFVGLHFAMSHPLRPVMVRRLGDQGFQAIYSLVVLAALGWMAWSFWSSDPGAVVLPWGYRAPEWIAASLLSLIALVLIVAASTPRNPAMALPGAEAAMAAEPAGALRMTRHPMMWGFALWGVSHIVAAPTARTVIVSLSVIVLALGGAAAQDAKKRALLGASWSEWEAKTSFVPRLTRIAAIPPFAWLVGSILWLAISWLHGPIGGVPAGIWRWLG